MLIKNQLYEVSNSDQPGIGMFESHSRNNATHLPSMSTWSPSQTLNLSILLFWIESSLRANDDLQNVRVFGSQGLYTCTSSTRHSHSELLVTNMNNISGVKPTKSP